MRIVQLIFAIGLTATYIHASKTDDLGEGLAALGIKPDQIFAETKGFHF